ncbi:MAG: PaaI family thioesterase [Desulfatiglandales bacterium]
MEEKWIAFRRRVENEPYACKMGIRLLEVDTGYALVEMEPRQDNLNLLGMTHGGAIFSLIDEAFEISSNSHGNVAVALNMSVTYHQAPELNSVLRAESFEIHRSRRTATYEIKVRDAKGTLIASCSALVFRKQELLPFLPEEQLPPP